MYQYFTTKIKNIIFIIFYKQILLLSSVVYVTKSLV